MRAGRVHKRIVVDRTAGKERKNKVSCVSRAMVTHFTQFSLLHISFVPAWSYESNWFVVAATGHFMVCGCVNGTKYRTLFCR